MRHLDSGLKKYIDELLERYPILADSQEDIIEGYYALEECFKNGGKLLVAGNGGSCADANHIVGELMKGFCLPRNISEEFADKLQEVDKVRGAELADKLQNAFPAIALDNHNALSTAFLNDIDGKIAYAQQVNGYGRPGDVFLGISTSGNSENILYAAVTARAKGLKVLGLTGKDGGQMKDLSDICVRVNEAVTYKVQELHLPIYHCWCLMVEEKWFGGLKV